MSIEDLNKKFSKNADGFIVELFSKYGEIKRVFNLIPKRGMAFITFVRISSKNLLNSNFQLLKCEG